MKVDSKSIIKKLSDRILKSSKQRNIISVLAISMTTILFTAMFTMVFSLNASYESYNFRQIGGYNHGSFKNVTEEQIDRISKNKKVKNYGIRKQVGIVEGGVFSKQPAEISYMDSNTAKWSYINIVEGRLPEKADEIALDIEALKLLGVPAKLGSKVNLSFEINDRIQSGDTISKEFILVGYWEQDKLLPIHYINVSQDYAERIEGYRLSNGGESLRSDMNIMLSSSRNIEKRMISILEEESLKDISVGVNWGYSSSQIDNRIDMTGLISVVIFSVMVILTGYLIISNIFYISVNSDIRFYGLLKTIGVTSKQLKTIVYRQVVILCLWGIPIGVISGYTVGNILTPYIIEKMGIMAIYTAPREYILIFVTASIFSFFTVMFSCLKPSKYAGQISPIEATNYFSENNGESFKVKRRTKPISMFNMAIANVERNRKKFIFAVSSITLSIVLFNLLTSFVSGFSMDKYLEKMSDADFVVSSPDYFRYRGGYKNEVSDEIIKNINDSIEILSSGAGYVPPVYKTRAWITEEQWKSINSDRAEEVTRGVERENNYLSADMQIIGFDNTIMEEKISAVEGDLKSVLNEKNTIALVLKTDDYKNPVKKENYPKIGDKLKVDYIQEVDFIDSRTGKISDESTPQDFIKIIIKKKNTVSYRVGAYITIPYSIGFRYSTSDLKAALPIEILENDSGGRANRLYYLFDTPSKESMMKAESYLKNISESSEDFMYESKYSIENEFKNFKNMFTVIGGLLCIIIGTIGMLNYANTLIISFVSRKKEFETMRAVGMTANQLKKMLIFESYLYLITSFLTAAALLMIITIPLNTFLEKIFWFFERNFTVVPMSATIPILSVIGLIIPNLMYLSIKR